jgi:cytochrome P450
MGYLLTALLQQIDRLCEALEANDAAGKSSDLFYGLRCFSLDTILQYCFNLSIDALGAPGFKAPAVEAMEASLPTTIVFRHFPLLRELVNSLPTWISMLVSPATTGLVRLRALLGRQVKQAIENPASLDDTPHETVYHRLLDEKANNGKVPEARILYDEAQALILAAGHPTANALTVGTFHVLSNNDIKERLVTELKQGWPDLSKTPTFEDLEQLPYLTAVITESLRMSPGIVSPLLRITPFGGATIGGIKVPSRVCSYILSTNSIAAQLTRSQVIVGMSGTFVHESEVLFHDAKTFNPDRWLADDSAVLERWLVPFSKGPRMCIGQNLAYCEMFLGFAALFRRFDLRLDGNTGRDLRYRECHVPQFLGKHLTCFCRPVEE